MRFRVRRKIRGFV